MSAYSTRNMLFETNGVTRLTISSTGAATFSSSVSVGGTSAINTFTVRTATNNNLDVFDNTTGVGIQAVNNANTAYKTLSFFGSSLSFTGAATFSSSVSVNGDLIIRKSNTQYGTIYASAGNDLFIESANSAAIYYNSVASLHQWRNNGSNVMTLNSTGLGIGTTSPSANLVVGTQSSGSSGASYANDNSIITRIGASNAAARVVGLTLANTAAATISNEASLSFIVANNYSATCLISAVLTNTSTATTDMTFSTFSGGLTERMRITNAGELLIGTTTDSGNYKLQVNGNIYAGGGGDLVLSPASSGGNATLYNDNGYFQMDTRLLLNGSIKTSNPNGGTAAEWKLGSRLSGTVSTSTTNYLEVDINGTLYYLAFAVPL